MRKTLLAAAIILCSGASLAQQKSMRMTPENPVKQLDRHLGAVDSSSRLPQVELSVLDSLRRELVSIRGALNAAMCELALARSTDSTLRVLCAEIDLLKLDNQMLQARLEVAQKSYVSTDSNDLFEAGQIPAHEQTPSPTPTTASSAGDRTVPNLKISGYIDAAASYDRNRRTTDWNLTQVQLDLDHSLSGQARLRADVAVLANGKDEYVMELEQGYVCLNLLSPSRWELYLGRFNSPIGIERIDPDQTYLYTRGFLFDYALPSNLTGVMSTFAFGRSVDLAFMAANGWNINADNNTGKTFGSRINVTPASGVQLGVSALSGPELDDNTSSVRTIFDLDATVNRFEGWNLGFEFHRGEETHHLETGATARWTGAMLVGHASLGGRFCATGRLDYLNDCDGSRTGVAQRLTGLAVAPAMSIADGLDMILELRQNWSTQPSLGGDGAADRSAFSSFLEFTYSF